MGHDVRRVLIAGPGMGLRMFPSVMGGPTAYFGFVIMAGLTYNPDSHPWCLVLDAIDRAGLHSVMAILARGKKTLCHE